MHDTVEMAFYDISISAVCTVCNASDLNLCIYKTILNGSAYFLLFLQSNIPLMRSVL